MLIPRLEPVKGVATKKDLSEIYSKNPRMLGD